jgi:hypothetical protein
MNVNGKGPLMPEVFSVVVLYEDRETRDRVLDASRHMEAQVGDEIALKFSWWKFDFLNDSRLAEQAAQATILADMLLVSAHPGHGLPLAFSDWVETWLPRRGYRESVLVALIGSEHDSLNDAACQYLRTVAARAQMDYLAKPFVFSSNTMENLNDSLLHRAETKTPVLDDILSQTRPPSHWGINE